MELLHGVRYPACQTTEARQGEFISAEPQSPSDEQGGDDEIGPLPGRFEYDVLRLSELPPFAVTVKGEVKRIRQSYRAWIPVGGRGTPDEAGECFAAAQPTDRRSAPVAFTEDLFEKAP